MGGVFSIGRELVMVSKAIRINVVAGFLVASCQAFAANVIVNGSFEASLSGWTEVNDGSCSIDAYEAGDPLPEYFGDNGVVAPAPTDGSFILVTDPEDPGTCSIYQDVNIPTGASATLTADVGYLFDESFPTSSGCSVVFEVTTPGGAPVAPVFSSSGTTNLPIAPQGPVDLSAEAGSTVRISAEAVACFDAPVGLLLDNVVLDVVSNGGSSPVAPAPVPTLSAYGMVLTALGLIFIAGRRLRGSGS